jgi:hypothetical protein
MHTLVDRPDTDEITKVIHDGPTLMAIRRRARIARERLELVPDLAAAADELEAIERLAREALR